MPCVSDYDSQSGIELESIRVCKHIIFLYESIKKEIPKWIIECAENYFGNTRRLNEATRILCDELRSLTKEEVEKFVYNAHNKKSRDLASWWERHQEWDNRRVTEEKEAYKQIMLKDRALQKLTIEEIEALGLLPNNKINNQDGPLIPPTMFF